MEEQTTVGFYAFICCYFKDTKWGKHLRRNLEGYKVPTTLYKRNGWKRKPINSIFLFSIEERGIGGFHGGLKGYLENSRHFIVVCSPHSAKSRVMAEAISYFHSIGRSKDIHFFIVDGIPDSSDRETECFNPVVKKLGITVTSCVNINEKKYRWSWLNRQRAYVQLIAALLGVESDLILQHHKRRAIQKLTVTLVVSIITASLLLLHWLGVKGL